MDEYQLLSLCVAIVGLFFITSPQYLMLREDSSNYYLKSLYDHRQMLGAALLAGSVFYNLQGHYDPDLTTISSDLPSYDQAVSE